MKLNRNVILLWCELLPDLPLIQRVSTQYGSDCNRFDIKHIYVLGKDDYFLSGKHSIK